VNRAEKYAAIIVFAIVLGSTLFFSALLYMDNYHIITDTENVIVVSVTSSGYLAQRGITITYPFQPSKTYFSVEHLTSDNAFQVIQWAIDNADEVYFTGGYYHMNSSTVYVDSNSKLDGDGGNVWFVFDYVHNIPAFSAINVTNVRISHLGFLTAEQYLERVD